MQPNDYVDEGYVCTQVDGKLMEAKRKIEAEKLLFIKVSAPDRT